MPFSFVGVAAGEGSSQPTFQGGGERVTTRKSFKDRAQGHTAYRTRPQELRKLAAFDHIAVNSDDVQPGAVLWQAELSRVDHSPGDDILVLNAIPQ